MGHETFIDQIEVADILIANKTDLCTDKQLQNFHDWSATLFPPKQQILTCKQGVFPLGLLDVKRETVRQPKFKEAHTHAHAHKTQCVAPTIDAPTFYESKGLGTIALGAIFTKYILFDADKLNYYLEALQGNRANQGGFSYHAPLVDL